MCKIKSWCSTSFFSYFHGFGIFELKCVIVSMEYTFSKDRRKCGYGNYRYNASILRPHDIGLPTNHVVKRAYLLVPQLVRVLDDSPTNIPPLPFLIVTREVVSPTTSSSAWSPEPQASITLSNSSSPLESQHGL